MQSADYVPGVSGWKIENGLIELNGGPHGVVRLGDIDKPEAMASQFFVDPARWAIKLRANTQGQYVAAGIGLDLSEFEQAKSKGADAVLEYIAKNISSGRLAQDLRVAVDSGESELAAALAGAGRMKLSTLNAAKDDRKSDMEDVVREVLRKEIRPGGLLWRR